MLTKIINNQRTVEGNATKFIGSTVPVDDIDAADTVMNKIRVPHLYGTGTWRVYSRQ